MSNDGISTCPITAGSHVEKSLAPNIQVVVPTNRLVVLFVKSYVTIYIGLFISPSGISELDCATTKTDTAERSISIGRKSL